MLLETHCESIILIPKHKLTLSDEETVLQIRESPYLQYFVEFSCFQDKRPPACLLRFATAWEKISFPLLKK